METLKRELVVEDVKGNREVAYALLTAEHPFFLTQTITEVDGQLIIESFPTEDCYDWSTVAEMFEEERLRHLINIGNVFGHLADSVYTYNLSPASLVFSRNAEPLFIFKGVSDQIPPYEKVTEEAFLLTFKAMIVSLLDKKADFESLEAGKLPFYKGKLFCETIIKADTLEDVLTLLTERYQDEKKNSRENFSRVPNKRISRLKITTIVMSFISLLSVIGVFYFVLFAMPNQKMISDLRLAFVHQDYSNVVAAVKTIDSKSLSQDDKYIVAYAVIMTEPLTSEQKKELSKISTQSNADYLRYWILIGQSKVDEAMDIASYLDDPQLMMYSLTKKIDEVQRDPELTSEKRTEQLNNYKSKLEELKETYLTPEMAEQTNITTTTTTKSE